MSKTGILKSSDGPSKTPNRVQFRVPVSVKTTLSEYVKGQENRLYHETISLIRDTHFVDDDLLVLLKELRSIVPILDKRVKLFVQVFLLIPWVNRVGPVVEEYHNFILDLLAAHNYYVDYAFNVLVRNFRNGDPTAGEDDPVPTAYEKNVSTNILKVISDILKVIPLSAELLIEQCTTHYPYARRAARDQELYVANLIGLSKQQPSLRSSILVLIFGKMILLDLNSPLEEVLTMEEYNEDEEESAADADMDSKSTITSLMSGPLVKRIGGTGMRHPLANVLDRKMLRLLDYFKSECYTKETDKNTESLAIEVVKELQSSSTVDNLDGSEASSYPKEEKEIDWVATKSLFEEVKNAFVHFILPTHGSHHMQFLMFYLVAGGIIDERNGNKGPQWLKLPNSFKSFLWSRGSNPNAAPTERLAAMGYLASFLARAKMLPISMVKTSLAEMCDWIHKYIARQEYTEGGSLTRECANRNHSIFNAVCHSLFYVIAFRHMDLSKTSQDIVFLQSLNLSRIVTAALNPLKTCAPVIAKRFASAVSALQLAYCATVMEANSRDTIPVECTTAFGLNAVVELIFPFDRYILNMSGPYINPLILEYQGSVEEEGAEDDAAEEGMSGDEEFDDFMDDSVYNNHKRTRELSMTEVYGTSPGMMDL